MMQRLADMPDGVIGIRACGAVTRQDDDRTMNAFDATISDRYDVAVLLCCDDNVDLSAIPQDPRFTTRMRARGRVHRLAHLGPKHFDEELRSFCRFTGADYRRFGAGETGEAVSWLLAALS